MCVSPPGPQHPVAVVVQDALTSAGLTEACATAIADESSDIAKTLNVMATRAARASTYGVCHDICCMRLSVCKPDRRFCVLRAWRQRRYRGKSVEARPTAWGTRQAATPLLRALVTVWFRFTPAQDMFVEGGALATTLSALVAQPLAVVSVLVGLRVMARHEAYVSACVLRIQGVGGTETGCFLCVTWQTPSPVCPAHG